METFYLIIHWINHASVCVCMRVCVCTCVRRVCALACVLGQVTYHKLVGLNN